MNIQDALDATYELGVDAFLNFTKPGSYVWPLLPREAGKADVKTWEKVNGSFDSNRSFMRLIKVAEKVNSELMKRSIQSTSLKTLVNWLADSVKEVPYSSLKPGQLISGIKGDVLVLFNQNDVISIFESAVNEFGVTFAKQLIKFNDLENQFIAVGLLNYANVGQASRSAKNVQFQTGVKKTTFRVSKDKRGNNLMNNDFDVLQSSKISFGDWNSWSINYKALKNLFAVETRKIASSEELGAIAAKVAECLNVPVDAVFVVLNLECGWPSSSKRAITGYRSDMPRDDGSTKYRGVSQASVPFWVDVSDQFKKYGITVPGLPQNASLAQQVAAPFVYADKYKNFRSGRNKLTEWPLTPGLIYSFHQQSLGGMSTKFTSIAGSQSGPSIEVVRATARMHGSKAQTFF